MEKGKQDGRMKEEESPTGLFPGQRPRAWAMGGRQREPGEIFIPEEPACWMLGDQTSVLWELVSLVTNQGEKPGLPGTR